MIGEYIDPPIKSKRNSSASMSMSSTTFTTSVPGSAQHGGYTNTKDHNNNNNKSSNNNTSGLFTSPIRATRGEEGRIAGVGTGTGAEVGTGTGVESRVGTGDSRAGGGKSGPSADCNEEKGTTIIACHSFPFHSIPIPE